MRTLLVIALSGGLSLATPAGSAPRLQDPNARFPGPADPTTFLDGRTALEHIEVLERIGPRVAGTGGESQAARYIESVFGELGYQPTTQPFPLIPEGHPRASGVSANVVAVKPGRSAREIIVGAHYDSEGPGNGADDNASGVAVMLSLAEALKDVVTPYTIRFVAFGAEEQGLQGSRRYVRLMSSPAIRNTAAMVNMDSLIAGDTPYVYGGPGDAGFIREWALEAAAAEGFHLQTQTGRNPSYPAGTTGDFSDHVPFQEAGIPYVYFESTNWNLGEGDGYTQVDPRHGNDGRIWHTRFDTLDYIEDTFPGRAAERLRLFGAMAYKILTELVVPPRRAFENVKCRMSDARCHVQFSKGATAQSPAG